MQTRFDGFERRIIQKLVRVQSPDLAGMNEKIAVPRDAIEEIHVI